LARVPAGIANARARSVAAPIANREPQKSTAEGRKCGQLFSSSCSSSSRIIGSAFRLAPRVADRGCRGRRACFSLCKLRCRPGGRHQAEDWLGRCAMNLMLINVSTRKLRRAVRLPEGDLPALVGDGTSKSAASRRFVALSANSGNVTVSYRRNVEQRTNKLI